MTMYRWLVLVPIIFLAGAAWADSTRLSFTRGGYWLSNPLPADFTLQLDGQPASGEAYARARLSLYKLSDPILLAQIVTGRALKSLSEAELLRRVEQTQPIWQGDLVLPAEGNIRVPLEAAAGPLSFGVYVLTAAPNAKNANDDQRVVQWFIRSTLALKASFIAERSFITVYDTVTHAARGDVTLRWCDATGRIIKEEVLPAAGTALLARPAEAAVLIAGGAPEKADFDYITLPPADKTHPIDGALIYPSASVHEIGKPFSFIVAAPGVAAPAFRLNNSDVKAVPLIPFTWRIDVSGDATGSLSLAVMRDTTAMAMLTVPSKTNLRVSWLQKPKTIPTLQPVSIKFKLSVVGKPAALVAGTFTLAADNKQSDPILTVPFKTDAKGLAEVSVAAGILPATAATYRVYVRVDGQEVDGDTAAISTYPAQAWLEIAPQFSEGAVAENVTAQFKIASRRADGQSRAVAVKYELAREAYKFEWYQTEDGRWAYRTKTALETVLSGTAQPVKGSTTVSVPVGAGRYRLVVSELNGSLRNEQSFTAGWWLMQPTPATPEKIELAAQVEGETAGDASDKSRIAIFIDPPFAAHVWVAAINANSGAVLPMVDVPDEGGFAYLPRTALQAGQPLLLAAYGIPQETGASLIAAEGLATLPLGAKTEMSVDSTKAGGLSLRLSGLPVDQPLDKNIVQAYVALYDEHDLSLWKATKLDVDTKGIATVAFAEKKPSAKLRARLFIVYGDRLNVTEQILLTPKSITDK